MNPWQRCLGSVALSLGAGSLAFAERPTPLSEVEAGEAKPSAMAKAAEALKQTGVKPVVARTETRSNVQQTGTTEVVPMAPSEDFGFDAFAPNYRYRPNLFAVETEYLLWWYRGSSLPPLVTSGSPTDLVPGALQQGGTTVLLGDRRVNQDLRQGGRFRLHGMVDDSLFSWDVGGFFLEPQGTAYQATSAQVGLLARPFYDTVPNTEGSFLVGFPGAFSGSVYATLNTNFYGLEANGGISSPDGDQTAFVGFRYAHLVDHLSMTTGYVVQPGGLAFSNGVALLPGAQGVIEESFNARTQFFGGQIGWRGHFAYGSFGLDMRASIAAGISDSRVKVVGGTAIVDANGATSGANAGILTQPSNIGKYDRQRFAVMPEVSARLSYAFTNWFSMYAGYDFLYWGSVMRAADQIDRAVDTRAMPTSANFVGGVGQRPIYPGNDTGFWAHGLNFGVRFQY